MNKLILLALSGSLLINLFTPTYSTTAVVTLTGAVIKVSQPNNPVIEKHQRKNCPVCKGKGWYISGDGIAKINCQYCE